MGITGMDHVEVWAKDMKESLAFYTDVLGFRHLRTTVAHRPDGTAHEQACITLGGMMVELIAAPAERASEEVDVGRMGVKAIALTVEDMEATAAALRERGVTFVQEPKPGLVLQRLARGDPRPERHRHRTPGVDRRQHPQRNMATGERRGQPYGLTRALLCSERSIAWSGLRNEAMQGGERGV